jgi:hypothetical protein
MTTEIRLPQDQLEQLASLIADRLVQAVTPRPVAPRQLASNRRPSLKDAQVALDDAGWDELLPAWWRNYGSRTVFTRDLVPLATTFTTLSTTNRGRASALGQRLVRHAGHPINGFVIHLLNRSHHAQSFRLVKVGTA